jgi:glutamine amidotransferase
MDKRVCIIDYGMGNLKSIANAFTALGADVTVTVSVDDLKLAERIVLPGVGAFGDGMRNLRERGWMEALNEEVIVKKKPFLGVCLGMQLLASLSTEHGQHEGFGWISGKVDRINADDVRVPHIGWNDVRFVKSGGLYSGMDDAQVFYFVHSYVFKPDDSSAISGVCSYGDEFTASIEKDNIYATQFHPEKSHKKGLMVLKNFLEV